MAAIGSVRVRLTSVNDQVQPIAVNGQPTVTGGLSVIALTVP
jgi:hypothetical protein